MPRDYRKGFLDRKGSPEEVMKFVSDALNNEGAANLVYPSGRMIGLEIRQICEIPPLGEIRKPGIFEKEMKRQAENARYESRREKRRRQI